MSGILVIGHLDLLQDDPQDILRKRIEKIDAILVVKLIPPGVRTDTADALFVLRRQFGILNIIEKRVDCRSRIEERDEILKEQRL